ncbi:AMP-binding protein [Micromonospora sp. NPDC048898]|uniref:AMP-binding protein n=1 Tax=Micromonospora sp. NPDC048898 TaxID=3364260 RepID=UPI00371A87B8
MTIATTVAAVHPDRAGFELVPVPGPATMSQAPTIGAALLDLADRHPDRPVSYVEESDGRLVRLTAADLVEQAAAAATTLAEYGVRPGDRVGVCMDTSAEAHAALHGCFLLGAVPFVSEPPLATMRRQRWVDRLRLLIRRATPTVMVVEARFRDAVAEPCREAGVEIVVPPFEGGYLPAGARGRTDDIALLQFTSGTTGDSRGVTLTHRAILANVRSMGQHVTRAGDLAVSWLPLHHDMGLIGLHLMPLLHGIPAVAMPPMAFALRPERWLHAMHRFRGTFTSAPNFAYQICATKIPDNRLEGLDLSAWRVAGNGAEVVNAATLRRWYERMAPFGFREEALMPCYGMAEIGLGATMHELGRPLRVLAVRRDALAASGQVVPAGADDPDRQELVSSGNTLAGVEVTVVDDDGNPLPDRVQGNVLLRTDSMMEGYYGQPDETAKVLTDGVLRTGDQGFLDAGELFVTGRVKDIIIIAGRNYHPYVFETVAATVADARPGGVAAVGVPAGELGTETLVLVVESQQHSDPASVARLREAVTAAVSAETGLRPDRVEIVPRGALAKTPSGKLQRRRIAAALREGTLG